MFCLTAAVATKAKFHITVGHETVMGHIFLFGLPSSSVPSPSSSSSSSTDEDLDFTQEYTYQEELYTDSAISAKLDEQNALGSASAGGTATAADIPVKQFVLVELEKPVTCSRHALMIGSKLDTDIHANMCRLAFHGRIVRLLEDDKYRETLLPELKVSNTGMERTPFGLIFFNFKYNNTLTTEQFGCVTTKVAYNIRMAPLSKD